MRIKYLSNIRMPSERANAVQTIQMCNAFAQCGHAVDLFVNDYTSNLKVDAEKYYDVEFEFNLIKVWVPKIISWGPIFFILSTVIFTINCHSVIRKEVYDLIYCRNEWILFLLSFFISTQKLVYESHEAKLTYPARNILKKGVRCIAISEGIKDEYVKNGFLDSQFLVAHDGIDESFFAEVKPKDEVQKNLGIVTHKPVVMYIGGFDAWKGIETFFKIAEFNKDIYCVVIGGKEEQVEIFSKKYPNVLFLGSRPYSELRNNQQAADVLVIPNTGKNDLSSKYTSPLKLFAHMSSGVPIVASNLPSIVNVVGTELVTLVEPDNVDALSQGVTSVVSAYDEKLKAAKDLIVSARSYTWHKRAEQISSFINLVD